jgi:hypothetical protein
MRDPGPPLCLACEIGIFVGVPDDDAGVVIRHPLARRGTRVVDLGQRRGSRSPCGPQNIQPTCGNRIPRKKAFCELRPNGVLVNRVEEFAHAGEKAEVSINIVRNAEPVIERVRSQL